MTVNAKKCEASVTGSRPAGRSAGAPGRPARPRADGTDEQPPAPMGCADFRRREAACRKDALATDGRAARSWPRTASPASGQGLPGHLRRAVRAAPVHERAHRNKTRSEQPELGAPIRVQRQRSQTCAGRRTQNPLAFLAGRATKPRNEVASPRQVTTETPADALPSGNLTCSIA